MRNYFHPSGEFIGTTEDYYIDSVDVYYQVNNKTWFWVSDRGVVHGMVLKDVPRAVQMAALLLQ